MTDDELIHDRHFTLDEAEEALPLIRPQLQKLRELRDLFTDAEARAALDDAAPTNGGGEPGVQISRSFVELRSRLVALGQFGVVVRDIESGLIDFPSFREGREIYLCWRLEEERITTWHEVDAGYSDRKPL